MTSDLSALLRASSDHVSVTPDFADTVLRSAKRRRNRRAGVTAATAAAVGVALAASLLTETVHVPTTFADGSPTPSSSPVSGSQGGPLADGRVHGNLAGDMAYLDQVQRTWAAWMQSADRVYAHPEGRAQILWAGTTPAGPAAVLQQIVQLPERVGSTNAGTYATIGYLGVRDGAPAVVAAHFGQDSRDSFAWYVDLDHRVLVVGDNAVPRGVAFTWDYAEDGTRTQAYRPLSFVDGAAVVSLPAGIDRANVGVSDLPFRAYSSVVEIANVELDDDFNKVHGLVTWSTPGRVRDIGFDGSTWSADKTAAALAGLTDLLRRHTKGAALFGGPGGHYVVHGLTSNGTEVRLIEDQLANEPAHLFLTYGSELRHGGVLDAQSPLPVKIRLPDAQGWIIAQLGAELRYRVESGPWVATRPSAALVPDNATDVEVTAPSGTRVVVPLR